MIANREFFESLGALYPIQHPYYTRTLGEHIYIRKDGFCALCGTGGLLRLFCVSRKPNLLLTVCDSCYTNFNAEIFNGVINEL